MSPSAHPGAFVHPQAVLIGAVIVEEDCYIGAGAVLRGDLGLIRIGKGSNVQENCVIHTFPEESAIVHPDVHIGHGSVLHGCEICSRVLVGMKAVIADGVKINSNCVIGAASFIPMRTEIPPNSLVVGSPAKVVKPVSEEHLEQIDSGLAMYRELTKRYLKSFRLIP
ncbi:MAG: gamma carbonic anhydrase family protein [Desulfomonile tiedjei]|uniref:Gamma carbonic anhydrase family protein n=1 Tax=Desulfomonile tiedjei TaxID=2358 RepID=A0A9D6Z5R8_9BACT|nr:gamma carbonic anhydrase family protein [Desulfomonile tiedjei]